MTASQRWIMADLVRAAKLLNLDLMDVEHSSVIDDPGRVMPFEAGNGRMQPVLGEAYNDVGEVVPSGVGPLRRVLDEVATGAYRRSQPAVSAESVYPVLVLDMDDACVSGPS